MSGSEESFVYTSCPGWGDHEYCAIKTFVKDGKIVRSEQVDYCGSSADEGFICQKGIMGCRQPYNPDRLKWPLKRVGERGSGKWERISWDQALDEIAAKMLEIRDTYGPESVAIWSLSASIPPSMGLGNVLPVRLQSTWGATDPICSMGLDNGPLYACQYTFGMPALCFYCDPRVFRSSDYIIVWGANPVENQMRIARSLVDAQNAGAKIVDIGLIFDGTAGMADWFLPVRAGSDPALALCMANVIVQNGWYDAAYLVEHTNLPMLMSKASGTLLRTEAGGYFVWDEDKGAAVATEPGCKEIDATPALSGDFTVNGEECETAFDALKRHLAQYTVEYAAELTKLPAESIERLTDEYAHAHRAYIVGALGLRYQNQGESYRAMYLLGLLTGNIGVEGGGVTSEFLPSSSPITFNDEPLIHPDGVNKAKFVANREFFKQVKTEDPYPIKAIIFASGNPLHNYSNRGRWVDDTLPKMELVVDIDVWMTDTGEYADYVLPDCMPYERKDIVYAANYGHIVLQEPAIEPPHEQKPPAWLYRELGKRLGLEEYFDMTEEDYLRLRIDSSQAMSPFDALEPKLTMERLEEEKMIKVVPEDLPPLDMFMLCNMVFPTQSARAEVFNERLDEIGYGFSKYFPPFEAPMIEPNEKHPYQFFTGRQRFFMQSMFTDDPVMRELSGGEPAIRMNPADAHREGFVDGDKIEAYNDRGHMVAKVRLDESVQPGMVHAWFGWRRKHYEVGTYAELLTENGGFAETGELGEFWWKDVVQNDGVGSFFAGALSLVSGSFDTLWDCACAVRKYEG